MSYREDVDKALGDARYDAWRAGLDPDRVSYDRIADSVGSGYYPDEAASREVHYLQRRDQERREAREAEEYGQYQREPQP